ncbi:MAG: MotA/TolQ/ExbB proton channel family protein [candidate division KSB1 bacterium]|nr:MotA/TolQ/ExbB proton channel family protein [candidate division KSB1 bacterium]MDZ7304551.1 MotA/TolQ/ExbB proton channel family protein [candidate division KSB1 bacterium]MDZ7313720.1 MotA/TolQ/ExbB proton channel family protein [candidate division KSB1 bacterium]
MKQSVFITTLLVVALAVSTFIYLKLLPDYVQKGGPLVILLITLTIMVTTFVLERLFSLRKAQGRGALPVFLRNVQKEINAGHIQAAIDLCDKQRGSCANIIRTGLERYKMLNEEGNETEQKEVMREVQAAIDQAMMLEVPLLEKNLIALSTIASIATMVGLLGTTIGMIRAFRALAHAGAPDAIQLSIGISEALINTAGGLLAAILGIVAYNFFTTKVDNFTYMIDEASYSIVQSLTQKTGTGR